MKIASITGVTTSGELSITKPIGSIILGSNLELSEYTTENITVSVERDNGNAIVLNRVLVQDLLLLSTFGTNVTAFGSYRTIAIVPLTPDGGAVHLGQNERIKITLDNLIAEKNYIIYGEEEPFTTHKIYSYEKKSCLVGEETRVHDFKHYDQILLKNVGCILDARVTYDNGSQTLHTLLELQINSMIADPVSIVNSAGDLKYLTSNDLVLPVEFINTIEFSKDKSQQLDIICRSESSLYFNGISTPRPVPVKNTVVKAPTGINKATNVNFL